MTKEKRNARVRTWNARNKEKVRAAVLKWQRVNQERMREYQKQWQVANPDKVRANQRKWNAANPDRINAISAHRRAAKLNATPPWLTEEQKKAIRAWYYRAKIEGKEVDHIVPLIHERVCGLHVPWNLQLLTKTENCRKNNSWA